MESYLQTLAERAIVSGAEAGSAGTTPVAPEGAPGQTEAPPEGSGAASGEAGGGMDEVEEPETETIVQLALVTGPLDRVVIRPAVVRVAVGRRRRLAALAFDASGLAIQRVLEYAWTLSAGVGSLIVEPDGRAIVEAGDRPGRGTLTVRVRQGGAGDTPLPEAAVGSGPPQAGGEPACEASAEAEVLVEAEAARRAFPPPVFVHAPGEAWRSRWNGATGKLEELRPPRLSGRAPASSPPSALPRAAVRQGARSPQLRA